MTRFHETPIVVLHGWGMNAKVWEVVRDDLEQAHTGEMRFLDLPGFGHNREVPENYDLNALADWLNGEVLEASIVIGWSLGGLIAQRFAKRYPNKVARLGLVASTPKFLQSEQWPGIKPEVLQMFAEQLQKNPTQTIERFLAIQAMGSATAKQDIKQLRELVLSAPSADSKALAEGLNILHHEEEFSAVEDADLQVHLLLGRLDSLVPQRMRKLLVERAQNTQVDIIAKASHAPFISHKTEFLAWFERLRG